LLLKGIRGMAGINQADLENEIKAVLFVISRKLKPNQINHNTSLEDDLRLSPLLIESLADYFNDLVSNFKPNSRPISSEECKKLKTMGDCLNLVNDKLLA
jgi:hypothetical protein